MITKLPLEIQTHLLQQCPTSALKYVNSHFYVLYNQLFHNKLTRLFGDDVNAIVYRLYKWIRTYIRSLDVFRETTRTIVASRLQLTSSEPTSVAQALTAMYIADSWKYIFSLFKNKRLFAEYSDYKIDEPSNYVYNHYVEINRTYLLSYSKTIWLTPGEYNLNIALVIKHGAGLGTTKFEIKYESELGKLVKQTFYPPTNINEMLPKKQFCLLKIGEFSIPQLNKESPKTHKSLVKVQLTMEEIGLYLKSGFRIFFIDIALPSMLFNDYDLLYYSCPEREYKYFINIPLKNFYKALNTLQSGGDDDFDSQTTYGSGSLDQVTDLIEGYPVLENDADELMAYANFFYKNTFNQRHYKFNTIYQRRQFVNRFGNFEQSSQPHDDVVSCTYDVDGLKWRIPILGEL